LLLIPFPAFALAIFALTLAFAPLHPKIGGLAWILFGLMGLVTYLRSGALTARNLAPSSGARNLTPVEQAACVWLLACLVSGILRIIPHSFWHDDWGRRHAEARLLLGALASAALVKWPPFYRLMGWQRSLLGYALSLACVLGMMVTALHGRETPLHPIAWSVGLSFIVVLLAPMTLDSLSPSLHRKFWMAGVVMGLMGVLLSQSRGVYGLLIWLVLAGFVALMNRSLLRTSFFSRRSWLVLGLVILSLLALTLVEPYWLSNLAQRWVDAWTEATMSSENIGQAANTSVGARLYLWGRSLEAIELQPIFGYGKENSVAMIKAWGREINSEQIQILGHLHNEFLDAWTSHGLLGLLSLLVLSTGLGLAVHKLWVPHPVPAFGLLGILFMHLSAGLSNVNMAHNYYGAMLSLSVGLALVLAASEERALR
jgi:O-antigen ligase